MSSRQPGPWLFALGLLALGLTQIAFQTCLPGLKPLPPGWEAQPVLAMGMALVLALAAAGLLVERFRVWAGRVVTAFWVLWFAVGHVPGLVATPSDATLWVSAAEVLTFAAVAWMLASGSNRGFLVARGVLGLTLILFGAVHWLYPQAIAGMIPDWVPAIGSLPWITGAVQVAAGVMILLGAQGALAGFFIGLLWLGWVVVIHLPRLSGAPSDLFEWTFMLTAVSLAGAAWSVGERFPTRIRA